VSLRRAVAMVPMPIPSKAIDDPASGTLIGSVLELEMRVIVAFWKPGTDVGESPGHLGPVGMSHHSRTGP